MKHIKQFALILALIITAICMSSCQKSDAKKYDEREKTAEGLLLAHRYAEAAEQMEELKDYDKAVSFARYCRGLEAGENGEFDTAIQLFRSLDQYRDSSKMCLYYIAREHEANAEKDGSDNVDDYLSAAKAYQEVSPFRDSKDRMESCYQTVYRIAGQQMESRQYEAAEKIYRQLEKYLDSESLALKAKADALFDAGELAEAIGLYSSLDKQYQTHADEYIDRYNRALEMKEQKQYDEAREILISLGEFKDSRKQISECGYLEAMDLLENKNYDEAAALFSELGDYKDCSAMALECKYQKALDFAANHRYQDAAQILTSLNYYKDSPEQLERIRADELFDSGDYAGAWLIYSELNDNCQTHKSEYELYFAAAEEMRNQGLFDDARQQYLALGTYKESDQLAVRCLYEKAEQYEQKHYYSEALIIYESLADQDRINACHYQYGLFLMDKKQYTAAAVQFALCPDYQDSSEKHYQAGIQAFQEGDLKGALSILREEKNNEKATDAIYRIAGAASEQQEYELAVSAYDVVGEYQDARHERIRNYVLWSDQLFSQGKYDQYIQVISALGDSESTAESIRMAEYSKAKELMKAGEYEKAKAQLQLLDGYEDSETLLKDCEYELAAAMYAQKKYQEALASFVEYELEGYRGADEMITDCRYQIGRINEGAEDYQDAAELYELCGDYLDSLERWLNCCYRRAVQLADQNERDEAVRWFAKARKHQDTIRNTEAIAESYNNEGKTREADHIRQIIRWIRAENAMDRKAYREAAEYYTQITDTLIVKDREKEAYFHYGEELLNNGMYGMAAEMFTSADDYPGASEQYKTARLNEGNEALKAGEYDKARECFKEAGSEGKIIQAWNTEAEGYLTAGEYDKARRCFKEAGNEEKIIQAWNTEAEEYLTAGEYDKARACFTEAGNEERILSAWVAEAETLIAAGKYAQARDIYIRIGIVEKIPEIWNLEGEACLKQGQFGNAKEAFRAGGNQTGYEDAVFEEAKACISAEDYQHAYELLMEIRNREDAQAILLTDQGFIPYRMNPGDTIVFGSYEQDNNAENGKEPIEWIILSIEDYRALVISKYGLDCHIYNSKKAKVTWQNCMLRDWLNKEFLETAFNAEELAAIMVTEVDNGRGQGNNAWGITGGNNTKDRIYLLSYQEAEKYFPETDDRICMPTAFAVAQGAYTKQSKDNGIQTNCWWWLRSPGHSSARAARIGANGSRTEDDVQQENVCVRPVLWLDLSAAGF